ncbi:hypothetical protein [Sphingomonas azotifigens]|uniref:hypothetical protein n=1 Tax=Sphingomonas azotifigens TaxID=330920 RepID=UPI00142F7FC8|nr:hypothetical protein [Sphingomonas azotifigens]
MSETGGGKIGGAVLVAAVVVACALLSIGLSGHQSGAANNLFHLPILARLYDEPQFAGDAFIQSLRQYASGFWLVLRGVAEGQAALTLLLVLQILSRTLFFVGALAMATPLGLETRRQQLVFLLFVALAAPLQGTAPAGNGGLFIQAFTHSEVANATALFALALAARDRFGWAAVAVGLTFFINAFVAVWLVAPLGLLVLLALRAGRSSIAALALQLVWGGALAALLALPVVLNVAHNSGLGSGLPVDYRSFLDDYWPYHFLVWSLSWRELFKFAATLAVGVAAAWCLPRAARTAVLAMLLGFLAVWVAGTVLPFVTGSQGLLNLHLLRSSAMIVIVAVLALAALAARLVLSEPPADRYVWGPGLLASFAIKAPLLPIALPLLLLRRVWSPPPLLSRPLVAGAVFAAVGAAALVTGYQAARADRLFRAHQADWLRVADWAAGHTPPTAVFLLPQEQINPRSSLPVPPADQGGIHLGVEEFVSFAHRVSWVGSKEGAAVMWSPGYYREWWPRINAALRLQNLDQRLAYARTNGISYVVDTCEQHGALVPVHRSGPLCVYSARPS